MTGKYERGWVVVQSDDLTTVVQLDYTTHPSLFVTLKDPSRGLTPSIWNVVKSLDQ